MTNRVYEREPIYLDAKGVWRARRMIEYDLEMDIPFLSIPPVCGTKIYFDGRPIAHFGSVAVDFVERRTTVDIYKCDYPGEPRK